MKKITILSMAFVLSLFGKSDFFTNSPSQVDRITPQKGSTILSYNESIKDVKHSVVNISTSKKIKVSKELEQLMKHPLFRQFFGDGFSQENRGRRTHSLGSGVVITEDGYIITNNHVIEGADEIFVNLNGDDEYKAKVVGSDPKTDIAVIKIDAKELKVATFADSSNVKEGDVVFAIGNPFGVGSSITKGIVSALNKSRVGINQYENFIQTDASINPGNSGGALVDSRGAVIGINSAILSRSGGNIGIGFAIPSNMAKDIATKLIKHGKIQRGYLGVSISDLTKSLKDLYKNRHGAVIVDIVKGDSADLAGLKRGDLILKIDNKTIKDANDLKNIVASYPPGSEIELIYERDKKEYTTKFSLGDQSGSLGSIDLIDGLKLSDLTDEIRRAYHIPPTIYGVLITEVELDSDGDKIGFLEGDIIIQIENFEVDTIKDLRSILKRIKGGAKRVYINRGGYILIKIIDN